MEQREEEKVQFQNRCIRELNYLYRSVASGFQLSESAFWILYALADPHKEYTQQLFCDEWFLPKQTVNSSIKCLIKKNLIYLEHARLPCVKKKKVIRLTPAGKLFIEEKVESFRKVEREAFSNMTQQEQDMYIWLIQKQIYNLQELLNL